MLPSHQTADGRVGINGGKRQSMMSDRRSLSYETQCRQRRVATEASARQSCAWRRPWAEFIRC